MFTTKYKLIFWFKSAGMFPVSQHFGNAFKSTGFMPKPLISKLLVSLCHSQINEGRVDVWMWTKDAADFGHWNFHLKMAFYESFYIKKRKKMWTALLCLIERYFYLFFFGGGGVFSHGNIKVKFKNVFTSIDRCSFISRVDIFHIQTGSLGNGQETLKQ